MKDIEEIGRRNITQHKTNGKQAEGVASAVGGLLSASFIRKLTEQQKSKQSR